VRTTIRKNTWENNCDTKVIKYNLTINANTVRHKSENISAENIRNTSETQSVETINKSKLTSAEQSQKTRVDNKILYILFDDFYMYLYVYLRSVMMYTW
jgi:hypothetical protein